MSSEYYKRLKFEREGLASQGNKFEDLFCDIQKAVDSRFRRVKPYGNEGDRKNDGFIPGIGKYYQVYSPENVNNTRTVNAAVKKLEKDFLGLKNHWDKVEPIKEFYFVVNDQFHGMPPLVEQKMGELRKAYPRITFGSYTLDDLRNDFLKLTIDEQEGIIGYIPTPQTMSTSTITAIAETVEQLEKMAKGKNRVESLQLGEYYDKIEFNHLNKSVAELLTVGESQSYLIDDYFSGDSDKNKKSVVRDNLRYLYQSEKENHSGVVGEWNSSLIFYNILNYCSVKKNQEYTNATLILMSYFFISCDIFENPEGE